MPPEQIFPQAIILPICYSKGSCIFSKSIYCSLRNLHPFSHFPIKMVFKPCPFQFTNYYNVDVHSCHLLFDHIQFALIHGPNIPGFYATLFFTAMDFTSITHHIHNWALFLLWIVSSFFLELFLHSSPGAYWAPNDLRRSSFSVLSFCLFILFVGFSRREY